MKNLKKSYGLIPLNIPMNDDLFFLRRAFQELQIRYQPESSVAAPFPPSSISSMSFDEQGNLGIRKKILFGIKTN